MSLFSSIQMAGNSLQADQIGLQVVGQNLANANTPGYAREVVNYSAGPTDQYGALSMGTGVQVQSITQKIDEFLNERLRSANSDQASADTLQQTYTQLESVVGALDTNNSLGSAMNQFFSSISNILNQPESTSIRSQAVSQGQSLVQNVQQLAGRVNQLRSDLNGQVETMPANINRLTSQIANLNVQISGIESSSEFQGEAVGLTDQRNQALSDLSQLIGVRTTQQPDGTVSVYSGDNYLVYQGDARTVSATYSSNRGMAVANLKIDGINSPLASTSGQLQGLTSARDDALGGFEDQLDQFSGTLANEFNKVYSSGQGLTGFSQVTAQEAVSDSQAALNDAGLTFAPTNGSFQVIVNNTQTGASTTTNVPVDLLGTGNDTSLQSLCNSLNGIAGISAQINSGKLTIASASGNTQFAFANDTSGTLASLGINTFFTGSTASDLAINPDVVADPGKFAASASGVGADTTNATTLAGFADQPLASHDGDTINNIYSQMVTNVTEGSASAQASANSADSFASTLSSQQLSVSGVNIDEEAIQMMTYQQAYAGSAKYISTLNNLLTLLTQL